MHRRTSPTWTESTLSKSTEKIIRDETSAKTMVVELNKSKSDGEAFTEDNAVWNHFQILTHTMMAFGLFFPPVNDSVRCPIHRRKHKFLRIFSIVILTLHALNVVRGFFMFSSKDGLNGMTYFKAAMQAYYFITLICSVAMFRACDSPDLMPRLFNQYGMLLREEMLNLEQFCKAYVIVPIIGLFVLLLNALALIYVLFFSSLFNILLAPHPSYVMFNEGETYTAKVILFIYSLFQSTAWIFPHIFVFLLSFTLQKAFTEFNDQLETAVDEDVRMIGRIEQYRRRHQMMCNMCDTVDDMFKGMVGGSMALSSLCIICILYVLIWGDSRDTMTTVILVFWMLVASICMLCILLSGGMLNHQAHDSNCSLYRIEIEPGNTEYPSLLTFLSRVEGAAIGITALDMFAIDKPTILTVLGALLTYFMLLMTFNTTSTTSCNNTLIYIQEINGTFVQLHNVTLL